MGLIPASTPTPGAWLLTCTVCMSQPPAYDPLTHTLTSDGVELVDGVYHARYQLDDLFTLAVTL